ncbi:hypothetical protein Ppro_3130 [Pelobacter propionicus DSM 2379]|uniref:Uncharacterized protein n=2 Tax=Pelobacter propionicus TaxID=29543 RepID=A1ATQ3_PELPD|nr:hypothetical protein Ppro_3130 [Pelobacter propionicus DSM 2379]
MDKTTHKELVRKLRAYNAERDLRFAAWEESGYDHLMTPQYHPMPPELAELACGAKTRTGTPCKRKDIYSNGRCKFHGGLSTGPTTEEGKRKAAMNGVRPKKKRSL